MQRGASSVIGGHKKLPRSVRSDFGSNFGLRISFVPAITFFFFSPNFRGESSRLSRSGVRVGGEATQKNKLQLAAAPSNGSHLLAPLLEIGLKVRTLFHSDSCHIPGPLALETFSCLFIFSVSSFLSQFPFMPLPDPMHYLLGRGGRVCFSLWLWCSWESPLPPVDSQE